MLILTFGIWVRDGLFGARSGRSGYPKFSGRVIQVFKISGFENQYPKLQRVFQYPKVRVRVFRVRVSGYGFFAQVYLEQSWLHSS
jgi:hypothetical protein